MVDRYTMHANHDNDVDAEKRDDGEWVKVEDFNALSSKLDSAKKLLEETIQVELSERERADDAEKRIIDLLRGGEIIIAERDAALSRLGTYRERTIEKHPAHGHQRCIICKGIWAFDYAPEMHEDYCPNKPAVVERGVSSCAGCQDRNDGKPFSWDRPHICADYLAESE